MECGDFLSAAGATWEEKAIDACTACPRCKGNFPIDPSVAEAKTADDDGEVESLVLEIAELISVSDAGFPIDWTDEDAEFYPLFLTWREAEREVEKIHNLRFQAVLKSFFKDN